jgi:hypothetical protein
MTNIRIFKVGSRVALRGLDLQGEGTIVKIGRTRATLALDAPQMDNRMKEPKPVKYPYPFEYKNLRLLEG